MIEARLRIRRDNTEQSGQPPYILPLLNCYPANRASNSFTASWPMADFTGRQKIIHPDRFMISTRRPTRVSFIRYSMPAMLRGETLRVLTWWMISSGPEPSKTISRLSMITLS